MDAVALAHEPSRPGQMPGAVVQLFDPSREQSMEAQDIS